VSPDLSEAAKTIQSMAVKRAKASHDGIITAGLAAAAGRYASWESLDVDAAVAELREIAAGRADQLGEVARHGRGRPHRLLGIARERWGVMRLDRS
jgi:hypothetical protein